MGTEADYLIDQHFDREHGEHGEIPLTHDELVKIKQAQSNPPPEGSCGTCADKLTVCRAAVCVTTHHSLYKPVRKENDETSKI